MRYPRGTPFFRTAENQPLDPCIRHVAGVWGSGGREFESRRPDHFSEPIGFASEQPPRGSFCTDKIDRVGEASSPSPDPPPWRPPDCARDRRSCLRLSAILQESSQSADGSSDSQRLLLGRRPPLSSPAAGRITSHYHDPDDLKLFNDIRQLAP